MSDLVNAMIADSQIRYNKELVDIAVRTANSANVGHKGAFSNHVSKGLETKNGPISVPIYDNQKIDFRGGAIHRTGNPYHAALSGEGFFVVQTENGRQLLTRRGNFMLNENLELTTPEGYLVLGDGGPVVLNPQEGPYRFNRDGTIANTNGVVNRFLINTVAAADRDKLREAGGYFLVPENAPLIPAENFVLTPEAVEKSNTSMHQEAALLAEVSKRASILRRFASEVYENKKNLIRDLGKVTP